MKKILLCILVATIPYCIFLNATVQRIVTTTSDADPDSLSFDIEVDWDKVTAPVRPPLNHAFENLPAKDREGLHGPVKSVRVNAAEFIDKNGEHRRMEVSPIYEETFYDYDGERYKIETNRKGECGNGPPPPLIRKVYDDRELLIAEILFTRKNASIKTKTLYDYDADRNLLKVSAFDGDGLLQW